MNTSFYGFILFLFVHAGTDLLLAQKSGISAKWVLEEYSTSGQNVSVNYSDKSGPCYQRLLLAFGENRDLSVNLNDSLFLSKGSYSVAGNTLKIEVLLNAVVTFEDQEKYCGVLPDKRALFDLMLNGAQSFSITGDRLIIPYSYRNKNGIMKFKRI